jgi:hypothetical protein
MDAHLPGTGRAAHPYRTILDGELYVTHAAAHGEGFVLVERVARYQMVVTVYGHRLGCPASCQREEENRCQEHNEHEQSVDRTKHPESR